VATFRRSGLSSGGDIRAFFVDVTDGSLLCLPGAAHASTIASSVVQRAVGEELQLSFCSKPTPKLSSISSDGEATELNFTMPIPPDDYSLCMILGSSETVEVSHLRSTKRACTSAASLLQQMWQEKEFSDAELISQGHAFPVHRAVLCKASPVFAAAFRGSMREATTARVDIPEADPEAVEAMLRYIYAGAIRPEEAVHVLPLAHRYQLEDLVAECCTLMLQSLSTSNVAAIVKAFRMFRDQGQMADMWEEVLKKVSGDPALSRAALETM